MEERHKNYNFDMVSSLIMKAKGDKVDRSIRQYAYDAGVSPASIVRICMKDTNGKFNYASPEMLRRLTSESANPRGGVTFEELMVAAGYLDAVKDLNLFSVETPDFELIGENDKADYYELGKRVQALYSIDDSDPTSMTVEEKRENRNRQYKIRRIEQQKFETIGTGAVYKALANKGVIFTTKSNQDIQTRRYRPAMVIGIDGASIRDWCFEFFTVKEGKSDERLMLGNVKHILSDLLFLPADAARKITIVVDSLFIFNYLSSLANELSYKGDLSVVYLDRDTMCIEKEMYISHYQHNDSCENDILLVYSEFLLRDFK